LPLATKVKITHLPAARGRAEMASACLQKTVLVEDARDVRWFETLLDHAIEPPIIIYTHVSNKAGERGETNASDAIRGEAVLRLPVRRFGVRPGSPAPRPGNNRSRRFTTRVGQAAHRQTEGHSADTMATQEALANVATLLREWIDAEDSSDWALARRVPSTYTWKIVDYVRKLPAKRRSSLFDAFVAGAMFCFDPSRDSKLHPGSAGHPEFRAMVDSLPLTWSWDYQDVRALRAELGAQQSDDSGADASMPPEVIERAQAIRPTSSREIRAAVEKVFLERFGAHPEKLGAGEWRYAGNCGQRRFVASIDYGGRHQLRYEIDSYDPPTDLQVTRGNYERLVGAGLGQWDYLTADNLHESVELLGELVERVVTLPDGPRGAGTSEPPGEAGDPDARTP
jgi:hypothetical protein